MLNIKEAIIETLKNKELPHPATSVIFSNTIKKVFQKAYERDFRLARAEL